MKYQSAYRPNSQLNEFRQIARQLGLKLSIEEPILPEDKILPIVNLALRTLSLVSQTVFAQEQNIIWTDDVLDAASPTPREEKALLQVAACRKALLQTSYGLGVTNLTAIKKGSYPIQYEGKLLIHLYHQGKILGTSHISSTENSYWMTFAMGAESGIHRSIAAESYRGFGGFMQHLPHPEEASCYQLRSSSPVTMAMQNLIPRGFDHRMFYQADRDLPPLTQLGFSYSKFWYNHPEDPAIFDEKTAYAIPRSMYSVNKYFIRFIDLQFEEEATQLYGFKELQSIGQLNFYTVGNIVVKPEHVKPIRDEKSGFNRPKRLYTNLFISGLNGDDFLTLTMWYWVNGHPDDRLSSEHLQRVILFYQRAAKLLSKTEDEQKISFCTAQIRAYQKELLQVMPTPTLPESKQKILTKYTIPKEQTVVDKHLALRRAAAQGCQRDVETLLGMGAAVNSQGERSLSTALHHAVLGQHTLVCLSLIMSKADPAILDAQHKKPIDYAQPKSNIYRLLSPSQQTDSIQPNQSKDLLKSSMTSSFTR